MSVRRANNIYDFASPPPETARRAPCFAQVTNADEAFQVLMRGYASRHTASTAMNTNSSRSHAVFTLVVDTAVQMGGPQQSAAAAAVGPQQGAPGEDTAGVCSGGVVGLGGLAL